MAHPFATVPETHPRILREAADGVVEAVLRRLDRLPTLTLPDRESARQRRSERREAYAAFLPALLARLDLLTLRVGVPHRDGRFTGVTMADLAEAAGLTLRRAERVAADLVAAGILTVHPIAQRRDTDDHGAEWWGLAAIRQVSSALFEALGLGKWLREERARLYKAGRKSIAEAAGRAKLATASTLATVDAAVQSGAIHGRAVLGALRDALTGSPGPRRRRR